MDTRIRRRYRGAMSKRALILVVVAAVSLHSLQAQEVPAKVVSPEEETVRKLEREWLDAYEQRSAEAMDRIVAEDFMITFPNGKTQNKAQIMAMMKKPPKEGAPTIRFFTEEAQSRKYGDTVILTGRVVFESKADDKTTQEASRYTDTYVKREGRWQVVASHLSNVPEKTPDKK